MNQEQPLYTPTQEERTLAILSHILVLVGGFIAPLIIWLLKKDQSTYVAEQAKESLNFQITMYICLFICVLLMVIIIGIFLMWLLGIASFVLVVIATIKASEDKVYRYPINFRLIK